MAWLGVDLEVCIVGGVRWVLWDVGGAAQTNYHAAAQRSNSLLQIESRWLSAGLPSVL